MLFYKSRLVRFIMLFWEKAKILQLGALNRVQLGTSKPTISVFNLVESNSIDINFLYRRSSVKFI